MACAQCEDGFSLIELLVTVLMIGVLLPIGIASYTGFQNRAHDRDAQVDLRGSAMAESVFHLDNSAFTESTSDLAAIEPLVDFNVAGDPEGTVRVRIQPPGEIAVCMFSLSRSGQWWAMYHSTADGSRYGQSSPAACNATLASGWSIDGW